MEKLKSWIQDDVTLTLEALCKEMHTEQRKRSRYTHRSKHLLEKSVDKVLDILLCDLRQSEIKPKDWVENAKVESGKRRPSDFYVQIVKTRGNMKNVQDSFGCKVTDGEVVIPTMIHLKKPDIYAKLKTGAIIKVLTYQYTFLDTCEKSRSCGVTNEEQLTYLTNPRSGGTADLYYRDYSSNPIASLAAYRSLEDFTKDRRPALQIDEFDFVDEGGGHIFGNKKNIALIDEIDELLQKLPIIPITLPSLDIWEKEIVIPITRLWFIEQAWLAFFNKLRGEDKPIGDISRHIHEIHHYFLEKYEPNNLDILSKAKKANTETIGGIYEHDVFPIQLHPIFRAYRVLSRMVKDGGNGDTQKVFFPGTRYLVPAGLLARPSRHKPDGSSPPRMTQMATQAFATQLIPKNAPLPSNPDITQRFPKLRLQLQNFEFKFPDDEDEQEELNQIVLGILKNAAHGWLDTQLTGSIQSPDLKRRGGIHRPGSRTSRKTGLEVIKSQIADHLSLKVLNKARLAVPKEMSMKGVKRPSKLITSISSKHRAIEEAPVRRKELPWKKAHRVDSVGESKTTPVEIEVAAKQKEKEEASVKQISKTHKLKPPKEISRPESRASASIKSGTAKVADDPKPSGAMEIENSERPSRMAEKRSKDNLSREAQSSRYKPASKESESEYSADKNKMEVAGTNQPYKEDMGLATRIARALAEIKDEEDYEKQPATRAVIPEDQAEAIKKNAFYPKSIKELYQRDLHARPLNRPSVGPSRSRGEKVRRVQYPQDFQPQHFSIEDYDTPAPTQHNAQPRLEKTLENVRAARAATMAETPAVSKRLKRIDDPEDEEEGEEEEEGEDWQATPPSQLKNPKRFTENEDDAMGELSEEESVLNDEPPPFSSMPSVEDPIQAEKDRLKRSEENGGQEEMAEEDVAPGDPRNTKKDFNAKVEASWGIKEHFDLAGGTRSFDPDVMELDEEEQATPRNTARTILPSPPMVQAISFGALESLESSPISSARTTVSVSVSSTTQVLGEPEILPPSQQEEAIRQAIAAAQIPSNVEESDSEPETPAHLRPSSTPSPRAVTPIPAESDGDAESDDGTVRSTSNPDMDEDYRRESYTSGIEQSRIVPSSLLEPRAPQPSTPPAPVIQSPHPRAYMQAPVLQQTAEQPATPPRLSTENSFGSSPVSPHVQIFETPFIASKVSKDKANKGKDSSPDGTTIPATQHQTTSPLRPQTMSPNIVTPAKRKVAEADISPVKAGSSHSPLIHKIKAPRVETDLLAEVDKVVDMQSIRQSSNPREELRKKLRMEHRRVLEQPKVDGSPSTYTKYKQKRDAFIESSRLKAAAAATKSEPVKIKEELMEPSPFQPPAGLNMTFTGDYDKITPSLWISDFDIMAWPLSDRMPSPEEYYGPNDPRGQPPEDDDDDEEIE